MKVLFAGTPEFAATVLAAVLTEGHEVAGVLTQPDRPAGRGRRLRPSPVKMLAERHGLAVLQPASLRGSAAAQTVQDLAPEVLIVAAYGLILPPRVLAIPPRGCINVHASLLPRWRGAAPIQRAILAGDRVSGVSIMAMDAGLDTGPVLARAPCPIAPDETGGSLHDTLATLGAATLLPVLAAAACGPLASEPQDEALATYAARIEKAEAAVDWTRSAVEIERAVRAFDPWPVAHTALPDGDGPRSGSAAGRLRLWGARAETGGAGRSAGTVLEAGRDGVLVATGDGALRILRLQAPGARPMPAGDYLNAHPIRAGIRLGESKASTPGAGNEARRGAEEDAH